MATTTVGTVGILWRGDRAARQSDAPQHPRLRAVFDALAARDIAAEAVVFNEDMVEETRHQLRTLDGVLVWVDPITDEIDRTQLDELLREASASGTWVSSHPDVILKMGTKDVLVTTADVGWGGDTHLYATLAQFREEFPPRLAASKIRVLKQRRGNGGIGVWKVEFPSAAIGATVSPDTIVRIQHAHPRDQVTEDLTWSDFAARCEPYFDNSGHLIDQPFQPRVVDGMVRCYMVQREVVGFAHQWPTGEAPDSDAPPPSNVFGLPAKKTMYAPTERRFARLKTQLESTWIPVMQAALGITADAPPLLWDADFLYGPRTPDGHDTHVLCEVNVSCVIPFPDEAPPRLAEAVLARLKSGRSLA